MSFRSLGRSARALAPFAFLGCVLGSCAVDDGSLLALEMAAADSGGTDDAARPDEDAALYPPVWRVAPTHDRWDIARDRGPTVTTPPSAAQSSPVNFGTLGERLASEPLTHVSVREAVEEQAIRADVNRRASPRYVDPFRTVDRDVSALISGVFAANPYTAALASPLPRVRLARGAVNPALGGLDDPYAPASP